MSTSLGLIAFLLSALSLGMMVLPPTASATVGARPGSFTLPAIAGGPFQGRYRLGPHLGKKPIVLLFWATWCAPCQAELQFYERLYQRYHGQGLEVVGISMDAANTIAQAGPLARRLGLSFPVVSDLDTAVTSRLNPRRSAPFSVWIGRDGRIRREAEGFSNAERRELALGVRSMVREGRRRGGSSMSSMASMSSMN